MSTVSSISQSQASSTNTSTNNEDTITTNSNNNSSQQTSSSTTNSLTSSSSSSSTSTTKSKKYSALDINTLYKGKSLENPKTTIIVPKHGLQTVGKVGVARRVPPPANVGLKSTTNTDNNNSNNNEQESANNINIIPTGGQGWATASKEEESSSSSTSLSSTSKDLQCTNSNEQSSQKNSGDYSHHHPQQHQHHQNLINNNNDGLNLQQQTKPYQNHQQQQQQNQFADQEFPPISAAVSSIESNKIAKEANQNSSSNNNNRKDSLIDIGKRTSPPATQMDHQSQHHYQQKTISGAATAGFQNNNVHQDGGCEKGNQDFIHHSKNYHNNNNNNEKNSQHNSSASSSSATATSAQVSANDLFNLPTSNDFISTMARTKNDRRQPYPQSSNYIKKHKQENKFELDKPAIIDDQELQSLDQILKTDLECDWALEQEIDYSAKIEFTDDSDTDDEQNEKQDKQKRQTTNSIYKESQNLIQNKDKMNKMDDLDDHRKSSTNNRTEQQQHHHHHHQPVYASSSRGVGPPLPPPPPPPPINSQMEHNRYYGRKSDPLYEPIVRKDNEHYDNKNSRRGGPEYHLSSRSQQLPRGGNVYPPPSSATYPSNYSNADRGSRGVPPPSQNGPSTIGSRRYSEDDNWRPKRMKDDIRGNGRHNRDDDDDMLMSHGRNRDYRGPGSGSSMGSGYPSIKSQMYPPPNLPPRLQKQQAEMYNKNNSGNQQQLVGGRTRSPDISHQLNGDTRHRDRDYRDDRHRRTPPEYGNSGRYSKSVHEPASWRSNQPQRKDSNDHSALLTSANKNEPLDLSKSTSDNQKLSEERDTTTPKTRDTPELDMSHISILKRNQNDQESSTTSTTTITTTTVTTTTTTTNTAITTESKASVQTSSQKSSESETNQPPIPAAPPSSPSQPSAPTKTADVQHSQKQVVRSNSRSFQNQYQQQQSRGRANERYIDGQSGGGMPPPNTQQHQPQRLSLIHI